MHHILGGCIINTSLANTPAWVVCAWPPLLWQVSHVTDLPLAHLGTRVLHTGDGMHPPSGQTLWGQTDDVQAAGVAWDWVEIRDGVVAMSDPLGLVTNVKFLNSDGEALTEREVAVRLQQIVHQLPWQNEVRRALDSVAEL
jgi:hypothetical protein